MSVEGVATEENPSMTMKIAATNERMGFIEGQDRSFVALFPFSYRKSGARNDGRRFLASQGEHPFKLPDVR